jgi:glycerol-3-phosphate dehydrogenase (NAD(P)+)
VLTDKVAVLGAGSWGTVIAGLLARAGRQKVFLWARSADLAEAIASQGRNPRYLPELSLPSSLTVTADLGEAVHEAGVIVGAVPTLWARGVLSATSAYASAGAVVVNLAKGIEPEGLLTMSQLAAQVLPGRPTAVLTGPNLAAEVASGLPAATVVACADEGLAGELQEMFSFPNLRVYTNDDVVGCEVAGAVKNVLALGAGMADGLGAGDNARAAIITRGLAELARLGVAMGGHPWTFSGLAGLGDIVLTCTSHRSRNRSVGFRLGQGCSVEEATAGMHEVAEGLTAAPCVVALAERHGTAAPICEQVASVVAGRCRPEEAVERLLQREPTHERAGLPVVGPVLEPVEPC